MFDTADYSYILPTHRATIYFIGVVLAWYLRSPNKISFSKVSKIAVVKICLVHMYEKITLNILRS